MIKKTNEVRTSFRDGQKCRIIGNVDIDHSIYDALVQYKNALAELNDVLSLTAVIEEKIPGSTELSVGTACDVISLRGLFGEVETNNLYVSSVKYDSKTVSPFLKEIGVKNYLEALQIFAKYPSMLFEMTNEQIAHNRDNTRVQPRTHGSAEGSGGDNVNSTRPDLHSQQSKSTEAETLNQSETTIPLKRKTLGDRVFDLSFVKRILEKKGYVKEETVVGTP